MPEWCQHHFSHYCPCAEFLSYVELEWHRPFLFICIWGWKYLASVHIQSLGTSVINCLLLHIVTKVPGRCPCAFPSVQEFVVKGPSFVKLQCIVEDTVYCTTSDVNFGIHVVHNNVVVFPNDMLSLTRCQHCYNCLGLASQVTSSVILDAPFLIFLLHLYTSCVAVLLYCNFMWRISMHLLPSCNK